jgi:pyruvate kinase
MRPDLLQKKGGLGLQRRTRIVATLGPSTDKPGVLEALLDAGLDVARINFSHGSAEEPLHRVARLREAARGRPRPVAVLADLPGPKLRVILEKPLVLHSGQEITLAADAAVAAELHVTEPSVVAQIQPGQRILLDDGRLQLRAVRPDGARQILRVQVGGTLLPSKGINLPDTRTALPALTERDILALTVAARADVDWLALSFVRGPEAAKALREAARAHGLDVPVLAKMERPEAVAQAREIIEAFDGIMVARGDLGVEIPLERVPHVQKRLIHLARAAGKPVITATDMLDSMRQNPRPTRAEASDVANAIYDGTDAVMLSGETAVGDYPVEAVACMNSIACETESHLANDGAHDVLVPRGTVEDHLSHMICGLVRDLRADAIVTPTYSGRTARLLARHRPRAMIVAPTPYQAVLRRMALIWGLTPVLMDSALQPGEDRLEAAVRASFDHGAVHVGQKMVVMAGHPIEGGERFPTLRVIRVGKDGSSCEP